ncbi:deoxynucleoside triphosphate triphosphohydrolase SAMHD1-like [Pomacea canaliculata]|uniref:deoxynucleoside triphosphate triphosphohydrolase SAMHD1-like n=1 Tax=Pomacea canaliculata TaxID=400727 RepID=UPI000D72E8CA|nr:deoxynucleoside triphosphate triphosphohydrolase SAMHD1-like [Pomacea canaliculata]
MDAAETVLAEVEKTEFSWKVFSDPVHGDITLHPLCQVIVDTPQFQRLRHIKQLGGGYFVYPGAAHNRFEHSIGVYHLARKLVKKLQERHPENIDNKDVLCVEIAALCHDLGQGPFSHVFDTMVINRMKKENKPKGKKAKESEIKEKRWKHEDGSWDMLDHMIEQNSHLKEEMIKYGILGKENAGPNGNLNLNFIKNLINPPFGVDKKDQDSGQGLEKKFQFKKKLDDGRGPEKNFLYEIVANKRSEVDVDKMDYIARDCLLLGMRSSFDHDRFINFARVVQDADGEMRLCPRDKEAVNIYQLFQTRHSLHKKAYQHKVKCGVEYTIAEILFKAKDVKFIPGKDGQDKTIEECIDDMHAYTNLTDDVLQVIRVSKDPQLAESRELLKAFDSRDLFRCVAESKPSKDFTKDDRQKIKKELAEKSKISKDQIRVKLVSLDFGNKGENPLEQQLFYRKKDHGTAIPIHQTEVKLFLPEKNYQEHLFRVYLKPVPSETKEIRKRKEDLLNSLFPDIIKEVEEEKRSQQAAGTSAP